MLLCEKKILCVFGDSVGLGFSMYAIIGEKRKVDTGLLPCDGRAKRETPSYGLANRGFEEHKCLFCAVM